MKESKIKFAVSYVDELAIQQNGTVLIIGQVEQLYIDESFIKEDGALDLFEAKSVTVSGLNNYGTVEKLAEHAYVRVENK